MRRDHQLTPVTGLCFLTTPSSEGDGKKGEKTYLLAGEDTHLKVYDGDSRLRCQLRIFRAQPIHGISVGGGSVLLWGNQAVTVLPVSAIESRLSAGHDGDQPPTPRIVEAKAPDWIYDGAISPSDSSRGVLITAHNEALEFSVSDDTIRFGRIASPSRPILYSATSTWLSESAVLVAGGTVFGEILLWKCHFGEAKPRCEVLFVFTGHEGSIFGVDISPEIDLGGSARGRLLASCSDDRTIRVWDVSERAGAARLLHDSLAEARETGFGGSGSAAAADVTAEVETTVATSKPLAMTMGHISRIWHVRFPRTMDGLLVRRGGAGGEAATSLYSFGEDSTLQRWKLDLDVEGWRRGLGAEQHGDVDVRGGLTHLETHARHDGKHIWATALRETEGGEVVVATGGQDSKVNLLTDRSASAAVASVKALPSELRTLVMRDVVGKLGGAAAGAREAFHRFAFVGADELLATSTAGRLLLGSFKGEELTWKEIGTEAETTASLRACTSLKSPVDGVALLGTANKKIFIYRGGEIREVGTVPGKVADIFCLDSPDEKKLEFLVTILGGEEAMQMLTLDLESCTITSMVPLDLDNRFVFTAACLVSDLLILGSRHGYMSVFRRSENDNQLTPFPAPERRTSDSITSIKPLPTSSGTKTHIITTSRDGNYRIYELTPSSLALRHETAPAAVPNLEDAWVSDAGDLVLCGFRSKNFVVWNETRHEELVRMDCGGAHRAFAYTRFRHPQRVRFVFNKAATLGVYEQPAPETAVVHHGTLKRGTHGREVRAVAYSGRYIATGAEDTAIRIWEYISAAANPLERELRCVKVVKVHTAGLQSLKWLGQELLFSCSGNEEFMVWRVTELGGAAGLGLMREAVFEDRSADGDLRITSFDAAWVEDGRAVGITMAFSNSVVKTYRYTPEKGFELLARGRYTGACLTQVRHLTVGGQDAAWEVVTAATDGCLGVWKSEGGEFVLQSTARVHQSSVKALDIHRTASQVVVLTGGDDDALGITTLDPQAGFTAMGRAGVRKAHAAAINGLAVLRGTEAGEVVYATASNDQRVKMWKVGWREGVEEVTMLADEYSGVADAGDLEVIEGGRVVVGGVGLEVWDWASRI
ncbi:WD repeat protein [Colletotrichum karsti]|uniref:WD repeat protein n=1 Tax=Colletotrichum karsti TaxID=1095194 RepID=A0A9P6LCT6_9PEZI|nr:WD repeat protein [Colletotrichum karsti]KAF9869609.1 WD repeat protein [Colletotrichum karsti]